MLIFLTKGYISLVLFFWNLNLLGYFFLYQDPFKLILSWTIVGYSSHGGPSLEPQSPVIQSAPAGTTRIYSRKKPKKESKNAQNGVYSMGETVVNLKDCL